MTKNTRKFRQLEAKYQSISLMYGVYSLNAASVDNDIIVFYDYIVYKHRLNLKHNHVPPASAPNRYMLSDSRKLSPRQAHKLARFKQARVCEVAGKVVVVLDSNASFQ
jgi:hypothetical protein